MSLDLYTDPRAKVGKMPDTIITCRDFLDAVEKNLYGFNWVCPNAGDACTYRHMLPQGYVVNREKGGDSSDDEDEMTLEEKIEEERAALPSDGLTPVTFETFMKWKADRAERLLAEAAAKAEAEDAKKRNDKHNTAFMSGRALFTFNPDLFDDADDAPDAEDIVFEQNSDDEQEESKGAAASENKRLYDNPDNMEEEKKEEDDEDGPARVAVDQDLFADEGAAAADEDVDFD